MDYDKLLEFATETDKKYIDAIRQYGNKSKAAKALGKSSGTLCNALGNLERRAAKRGYSPSHGMTKPVPDGFNAARISTNYDADGNISQQWVIATPDKERQESLRQAMLKVFTEDFKGLAPVTPAPGFTDSDLLAVYPVADLHFGLYAWAQECGADFDVEIARKLLTGAVDRLIMSAPAAETAILVALGDTFHANDQTNQTPSHKHQLDVDTRYPRVLEICIQTFRHAVVRLLEKHKNVVVRIEPGNHDPEAKWALNYSLLAYFENEPRVTVDISPANYWFYQHGKVLLGTTHGDKIKQSALLGVMAADRPVEWGATKFRYWYTGHVHHQQVVELAGVTCEAFRTLAPRDSYATTYGYRAGRDMCCIVHHRDFGEIERHRCDVAMLKAA